MKNGTKKRAARNGGAAADDLEELFRAINTRPAPAAPPPDPPAARAGGLSAGDESGRAEVLAALADGTLLSAGADSLERLGAAVAAGWLDDPAEVTDATRRQVIDFVAARLRAGDPAEKIAAAAVFDAVVARPGAGARPDEAGPSPSGPDGDAGPSAPEGDGGRDRAGRFARGNKLSLGNASSRKMAALRAAFLEDIDGPKLRQLAGKLYALALAGDLEAAKLVLAYAVGKPREAPDPDALDVMEWKLLTAGPTLSALWHASHEVADVRFAAAAWKNLSASCPAALLDQLVDAVEREPQRFAADLRRVRARAAGR
jgi:hypothetical protein